jgi:23S rRNA (uracil1939-C5)-methyltransferase
VREAAFTDLLQTGQGVGRIDEMVVFAWGPLPGERARVRIETIKAKYAVAELLELLSFSPDRTEPFCGLFGACGGCQVQHLAYPAQLAWKRGLVAGALARIAGIADAPVAAPIGMDDPRRYRNKLALVVQQFAGDVSFGFYAARTHDLVPVRTCPVALPQLDTLIDTLWDVAKTPPIGDALSNARHIVARVGRASGEGVLSITTEAASPALRAAAPEIARRIPGFVGFSNSFAPPSANAVLGRKHHTLAGRVDMEEAIGGLRFRVSPASFFQVNSEMVGKIFDDLAVHAQGLSNVVDLYCGAGTFTLFFAKNGADAIGIEENPNAIAEAHVNAKLNGLDRSARFISARVETALREPEIAQALAHADVVFLDPPRKGSEEPTLRALVEAQVRRIWYLSCNPATLARDLSVLVRGGYRIENVQPFDMFPQTGHIEALVMLEYPNGR